jgi:hypothetical protein
MSKIVKIHKKGKRLWFVLNGIIYLARTQTEMFGIIAQEFRAGNLDPEVKFC